jgi:hypothetical protein
MYFKKINPRKKNFELMKESLNFIPDIKTFKNNNHGKREGCKTETK